MSPTNLFADAGGPLLFVPVVGGIGIAGLFAAAAAVSGGLWLANGRAAPRARKWFLISAGVACLGGVLYCGVGVMVGGDMFWPGPATAVLTAAAVALFYLSSRPAPPPEAGEADPPP